MAASERNMKAMTLLSSFVHKDGEEKEGSNKYCGAEDKAIQISRPRHHQSFLERTHTYSSLRWFAKPAWLSPLECARYGWENVDVDVLRCVSCKAHISGRVSSSLNPKAYDECCDKVKKCLTDGHCKACPWSSSPSPKYFLRLQLDTRPKAHLAFTQHLHLLLELAEHLPIIDDTVLESMGLQMPQLQRLVQRHSDLSNNKMILQSATVLAVTGWTTRSSPSPSAVAMMECTVCNRHVGLWNFLTVAHPHVETVITAVTESADFTPSSEHEQSDTEPCDKTDNQCETSQSDSNGNIQQSSQKVDCVQEGENRDAEFSESHISPVSTETAAHQSKSDEDQSIRLDADAAKISDTSNHAPTATGAQNARDVTIDKDDPAKNNKPSHFTQPIQSSLSEGVNKRIEKDNTGMSGDTLTEVESAMSVDHSNPVSRKRRVGEETQATPAKKKHTRETTVFNPVVEHHTWCPWVTLGGSTSGKQTGWEQVLYLLMPEFTPEKVTSIPRRINTTSPEVLRSIRRLFNEWASPAATR